MEIVTLFTEAAGLSILIFALVAQLKQFGLSGHWLTGSAYLVGLIFGGLYRYFFHPPSTPAEWFLTVTFGLICGLIATGTYKGIESATGKPANGGDAEIERRLNGLN